MSITGATTSIALAVAGLFPTSQLLQGFEADNVFSTDAIRSAEVLMGVDGILSAGFVFVEIRQTFMLQADSPSNSLFDIWWLTNQANEDSLPATGQVNLFAISQKWSMVNGHLTSYKPMSDTKKLLQPRHFEITWGRISPAPA